MPRTCSHSQDHFDYTQSNTSSYLDLSPLYGSDWDEQKHMRTFKDGKIKKDCFSESRILGFPPGVGVLMIMYNRHHNYIVEQLAAYVNSHFQLSCSFRNYSASLSVLLLTRIESMRTVVLTNLQRTPQKKLGPNMIMTCSKLAD